MSISLSSCIPCIYLRWKEEASLRQMVMNASESISTWLANQPSGESGAWSSVTCGDVEDASLNEELVPQSRHGLIRFCIIAISCRSALVP